jgi:hypothetical protein
MEPARRNVGRSRNVPRARPRNRATGAESLDYLSDMIEQLRALAERGGYPTVAGLLGRAQAEATVQRQRM